jgi:hypothetical protein
MCSAEVTLGLTRKYQKWLKKFDSLNDSNEEKAS